MNTHDRKLLADAIGTWINEEGFSTEEYDDFINFGDPERSTATCRVVRVIGPKRVLMLFAYDEDQLARSSYRREYHTLYLDENNEMREFFPNLIIADWRKANRKGQYDPYSWDKVVGGWLIEHKAMTFTGRGWATDCAMKVNNLLQRWKAHYHGGTFLGGWSKPKETFTDAQGYEYEDGLFLIKHGKVRAHVVWGSGTGYDKGHVFDRDGNCVYAAELFAEDFAEDGIEYDEGDTDLRAARKWCENRLGEMAAQSA